MAAEATTAAAARFAAPGKRAATPASVGATSATLGQGARVTAEMPTALDNGSRRARRLLPDFVRRLRRWRHTADQEDAERELRSSAELRSHDRPIRRAAQEDS